MNKTYPSKHYYFYTSTWEFWLRSYKVNYLFWLTVILIYLGITWNNFSVPTDLYNRITPAFKMNAHWKSVLWQHLPPSFSLRPSLCISIIITTNPGFILSDSFRQQTEKKYNFVLFFQFQVRNSQSSFFSKSIII